MRVLEVIHGLTPGGAESGLVRRLPCQPADVSTTVVCCTPVPDFRLEPLAQAGVTLVEQPVSFRDHAAWSRLVGEARPDVIVTHSPRETLPLLYWNRGTTIPLVVMAHHPSVTDNPRFRRPKEWAFRAVNGRADLHIAVSQAVAGSPPCRGARRVAVHMLGADLPPAEPGKLPWPEGTRLRLMTLSRLAWFKNIPHLVGAVGLMAPALRTAGAHLAIVGSGPAQAEIAAAIDQQGVADLVSMHPQVPSPTWLLEQADVLVSSATLEGGPLTLFEASLAGTRLLATPTGVAPDVIALDRGSVLADGSTPADLAGALRAAIALGPVTDDERGSRSTAAARWHTSRTSPQFYELLRTVVDVTAPPAR